MPDLVPFSASFVIHFDSARARFFLQKSETLPKKNPCQSWRIPRYIPAPFAPTTVGLVRYQRQYTDPISHPKLVVMYTLKPGVVLGPPKSWAKGRQTIRGFYFWRQVRRVEAEITVGWGGGSYSAATGRSTLMSLGQSVGRTHPRDRLHLVKVALSGEMGLVLRRERAIYSFSVFIWLVNNKITHPGCGGGGADGQGGLG